jgi:hypothetical protein
MKTYLCILIFQVHHSSIKIKTHKENICRVLKSQILVFQIFLMNNFLKEELQNVNVHIYSVRWGSEIYETIHFLNILSIYPSQKKEKHSKL